MKTQHTPGKWYAINSVVYSQGEERDSIIAECRDTNILTSSDSDANARLIAAAPELLDRLEKTTEWIERFISNNSDLFAGPLRNYMGALDEAQLVNGLLIKKAKGE